MDRLSRSLDARFPPGPQPRSVRVWSLEEFRTREVRVSVLVLAGAVVMVLLIACVNVANLLLARARVRRGESGPPARARRRAAAASWVNSSPRARCSALTAGAVGVGLAYWGIKGLSVVGQARVPSLEQAGIDLRAVGFALLDLGVSPILIFGLGPALALDAAVGPRESAGHAEGREPVAGRPPGAQPARGPRLGRGRAVARPAGGRGAAARELRPAAAGATRASTPAA